MSTTSQFFGYAKWWILAKLGKRVPLVNTMCIHYGCNLRCRHCAIAGMLEAFPEKRVSLSYDDIVEDMRMRHDQGTKIVYFEGGETTLWRDGDKDLGDVIDAAKEMGYFNVGYTTNGTTGRIFTNSDVISVSLDGPKEIHDFVRGEGTFDKLMDAVDGLNFDGTVYANMVLQKGNLESIRETAQIVRDHPTLSGIVYNFITPPPYELMPSIEEKENAVEEIRTLKDEGFPILNSRKGLKLMTTEDWDGRCPRYVSAFVLPDGMHVSGCPMTGTDSCRHCGYAAVREYYLVDKGSPSTIMEMSSIFAMSK